MVAGVAMALWLMLVYWADGANIYTPLSYIGHVLVRSRDLSSLTQISAGLVVHLALSAFLGIGIARATEGTGRLATTIASVTVGLATWLIVRYVLLPWFDPLAARGLEDAAFVSAGVVFGIVHALVLVTARHGVRVLLLNAGMGAGLAAAAGALGMTAALAPSALLHIDRPLSAAIRGEHLVFVLNLLTRGGSQRLGVVIAAVAAAVLWNRCRPLAIAWPVGIVAAILGDVIVKVLVDRPRPPDPQVGTALGSFPSGHVLTAVVIFGLLAPTLFVLARSVVVFWGTIVVSLAAVFIVAYSRIYLGAHWPSDVVGSVLIGLAVLVFLERTVASAASRCQGCSLHPRELSG